MKNCNETKMTIENPFNTTYHIAIQLSNLCNYSWMHRKCPAHHVKEPVILSSEVVYDIINTLKKYNYGKGQSIAFYLYNDSLNDPRLFTFIERAAKACPNSNIIIGTNGWYLTDIMVRELYNVGVTFILVTAYTDSENERFINIKSKLYQMIKDGKIKQPNHMPISFWIRRVKNLDDRMDLKGSYNKKCYSPLTELIITPEGRMKLCCLDVKEEQTFGNLYKERFEKIVRDNYDRLNNLRYQLMKEIVNLEVCKRCIVRNRWKKLYEECGDYRYKDYIIRK
jgi:radical SAM protein with 4Fe4S-binding SPASM domain